jgi:hypothetical protein
VGGAAHRDRFYDLSNDVSLPSSPRLDVGKILGLLVKANEMATSIRTRVGARQCKGDGRIQQALLDLVSAVVQEGILPVISPANASFVLVAAAPVAGNPDNSRPWMEPGATQLKAALALAKKKLPWSLMRI